MLRDKKKKRILVYGHVAILWTNNAQELEGKLNWLKNTFNKFGFKINLVKTKNMLK